MNGRARVEIVEIDLSTRVPSFPGIYGAMVINTSKGDVLNPKLITSESELFRLMMSTDTILPRDPISLFEARIFLQKSNKLWICRPDTGATYGGVYLSQDIPYHSIQVSVNEGRSGLFLRTTTEEEKKISAFTYSTLSDGDVIQLEGNLPSPLKAGTNYYLIKFSTEKYGIRIANTREDALEGKYIQFESTGSSVTINLSPDDVNGEQQYPVRDPDGYELDTSDGKAAGFESTFTVDMDGDFLNVPEAFYTVCNTSDIVVIGGEESDLPEVDSGLPLKVKGNYYIIKIPQEGVNADKFKIQLARTLADANSGVYIGFNSLAGKTFSITRANSSTETDALLDVDTDLFAIDPKFYSVSSNNDKVQMTATEYPQIATISTWTLDEKNIDEPKGCTLLFDTSVAPNIITTDESKPSGYFVPYGIDYIGIWRDAKVDNDIHFGLVKFKNDSFTPVEDFYNTTEGWKKSEYELTKDWVHKGDWTCINCTGLYPSTVLLVNKTSNLYGIRGLTYTASSISVRGNRRVSPGTVFYLIKSPDGKVALSLEKDGVAIDFINTGTDVRLINTSIAVTCSPSIDLSSDSIKVSESFFEEVETGNLVKVYSDGRLPTGLSSEKDYYVIKTDTPNVIKLATTVVNAEEGVPVDILDTGILDTEQNQYHHIVDKHNEILTGYKRRIAYMYTSSPTDEDIYYKLYHYPYGDKENWTDFDQDCADLVKEPGAFLVILYKKYDDQYLEVERFIVSRDETHVDGYGRNIYVERVFEQSNYVRWKDNRAVDKNVFPCNQTTYAKLTGGSLGHSATTGECITALKLLGNKRRYPITLIMDAGWSIPAYQQAIIDVCESRGSTLGILSTPIETEQSSNYLEDLISYRRNSLITSTSHAALYSPHVKIYDEYNDREIFISPTGHVGACISNTAANYEPWFAPAGNKRGVLNVLGVSREFNDGDEDALYDANINPIDFHETYGIRIWGQKTLLSRASALDRVNVRLLLIVIEPAIEQLLMDYVFDAIDTYTMEMIVSKLTPYLASIQARRGMYAFKVVCDSSNNTPETIDNNELIVDVAIQPTRVAELIRSRIFINSTGALLTVVA